VDIQKTFDRLQLQDVIDIFYNREAYEREDNTKIKEENSTRLDYIINKKISIIIIDIAVFQWDRSF